MADEATRRLQTIEYIARNLRFIAQSLNELLLSEKTDPISLTYKIEVILRKEGRKKGRRKNLNFSPCPLFADRWITTQYGLVRREIACEMMGLLSMASDKEHSCFENFLQNLSNHSSHLVEVMALLNELRAYTKGEKTLLFELKDEIWMFIIATFLAYQRKLKQQLDAQYQSTITKLDDECASYQQYLEARIAKLKTENNNDDKTPSLLQVVVAKCDKLNELRTTLQQPGISARQQLAKFTQIYNNQTTQDLLREPSDAYWRVFFRNIGCLLYSFITLGMHPGLSNRYHYSWSFWKTPEKCTEKEVQRTLQQGKQYVASAA